MIKELANHNLRWPLPSKAFGCRQVPLSHLMRRRLSSLTCVNSKKEVGVYYESRREAIHGRGKGLVRPREPRLLKRLVAESKPGDSFQHLINRFASVSQLFWVCGRDRGPSGSHLPSFRHHYRLLGHPFHQRDFMKWALLDHGQCCCIKFLPPFVTSGLI